MEDEQPERVEEPDAQGLDDSVVLKLPVAEVLGEAERVGVGECDTLAEPLAELQEDAEGDGEALRLGKTIVREAAPVAESRAVKLPPPSPPPLLPLLLTELHGEDDGERKDDLLPEAHLVTAPDTLLRPLLLEAEGDVLRDIEGEPLNEAVPQVDAEMRGLEEPLCVPLAQPLSLRDTRELALGPKRPLLALGDPLASDDGEAESEPLPLPHTVGVIERTGEREGLPQGEEEVERDGEPEPVPVPQLLALRSTVPLTDVHGVPDVLRRGLGDADGLCEDEGESEGEREEAAEEVGVREVLPL